MRKRKPIRSKYEKESVGTVVIVVVSLRYSASVVEVVSGESLEIFFSIFVPDKSTTVLRFRKNR